MIKRYKPRFDRLFYGIAIFTAAVVLGALIPSFYGSGVWGIAVAAGTLLLCGYFLVSPCFGYAELREGMLFVKFGFFLSREIPYEKIYAIEKKHTMIADSILSLKNAMDHLNVKYNRFELVSLSLRDEEDFIESLCERCKITSP